MTANWMRLLSNHYMNVRHRYPADELLILFDIDGTILDMRYMIHHVLREIDRRGGTSHFDDLSVFDIDVHEEKIVWLLDRFSITGPDRKKILSLYGSDFWSLAASINAYKAFDGVLEVIRLFQLQPRTHVGLNTGRPEFLRFTTLAFLNNLGKGCRVHFPDRMLHMKPESLEGDIPSAKVMGVKHFEQMGYRVFAFVDNEPENLEAVALHFKGGHIMLLHADTISKSRAVSISGRIVSGNSYVLDEFIDGFSFRRSA